MNSAMRLHGTFNKSMYPSLGRMPRDFVEYPSQVNEVWAKWPSVLENYARHYKTGERMPRCGCAAPRPQGHDHLLQLDARALRRHRRLRIHQRRGPLRTLTCGVANPKLANYDSPGAGTLPHLLSALLATDVSARIVELARSNLLAHGFDQVRTQQTDAQALGLAADAPAQPVLNRQRLGRAEWFAAVQCDQSVSVMTRCAAPLNKEGANLEREDVEWVEGKGGLSRLLDAFAP